jgi:hypothetical protein
MNEFKISDGDLKPLDGKVVVVTGNGFDQQHFPASIH